MAFSLEAEMAYYYKKFGSQYVTYNGIKQYFYGGTQVISGPFADYDEWNEDKKMRIAHRMEMNH
jgi:hypothetical protein